MAVRTCVVARRPGRSLTTARRATVAVLGAVSVALAASTASAQLDQVSNQTNYLPSRLSIAPEVGYSLPMGRLSEFVDAGPSATLGIAYRVAPRTQLLLSGGVDRLRGREVTNGRVPAPDIDVIRLIAGVETELMPAEMRPWTMMLEVGAGATRFDSDGFRPHPLPTTHYFRETSISATGGLQFGYDVGPVTLFADGQVSWAHLDEDSARYLLYLAPHVEEFRSAWTFPVRLGFRL